MKGLCKTLVLLFVVFAKSNAYRISARADCTNVPDGTLINDPSACDKYFICDKGHNRHEQCPAGNYFDWRLGKCDLKKNVDCKDTEKLNMDYLCENVQEKAFIDNKDSCASYYQCVGGRALAGKCPKPFVFNPTKHECDYVESYPCKDAIGSTRDEHCDGIPDNTFVNDNSSCAGYFVCIDGVGVPGKCPEGQYFVPATGSCDYKENVDCKENHPNPEGPCIGQDEKAFVNDPSGCANYFQCVDGKPLSGKCPGDLWFNDKDGTCDYQENVQCTPNVCEGHHHEAYINDPSSCPGYFQCMYGEPIPGKCPAPYYFNPKTSECDFPEEVDCEDTTNPTSPTPNPTDGPSSTDSSSTTEAGNSTNPTSPTPNPTDGPSSTDSSSTTEAGNTSTGAGASSTEAGVSSSEAQETTTEKNEPSTTEKPVDPETPPPAGTTEEEKPTEPPVTVPSTEGPTDPEEGTEKPEDGKGKPEDGKNKPEGGKENPEDGKNKPEVGKDDTNKPEAGKDNPEDGKNKPEVGKDDTNNPEAGKDNPEDGKGKPEVGKDDTNKPEAGKDNPEDGKVKPEVGKDDTNNPEAGKDNPEDGKVKPEVGKDDTNKPESGKDNPEDGKVKPEVGKDDTNKPEAGKDNPEDGKVKPEVGKDDTNKPEAGKDDDKSKESTDGKKEDAGGN